MPIIMRRTSVPTIIFAATLGVALYPTVRAQAPRSVTDGVYTAEQAKRGEMLYADTCASCHDPKLIGGVGPALAGKDFIAAWKDKTVGDVFTKIKIEMPLTAPGTLTPDQTADVLSFILSSNQFPAGTTALAADATLLNDIHLAESGGAGAATAAAGAAAPAGGAAAAGGAPAAAGGGAAAQSKRGEMVYADNCTACHGPTLGGDIGPALAGPRFVTRWKDKGIADLFDKIQTTMPASAPGSLMPAQTADVVSFILAKNSYPAVELTPEAAPQSKAALGEPQK
jgi:mono/diheme cytochrome c family protein